MDTKAKQGNEARKLALMLRIARHRDHDAFRELFLDYEKQALALAFHITGRKDLAEDAVQEAMVRVWRLSGSFQEDRSGVTPWIARIVARESLKQISKNKKPIDERTTEVLNNLEDGSRRGDREEVREEIDVLRNALAELSGNDRRILALRYIGEMNQAEISKVLSIPPRTISLRLKVALEKMKAKLEKAGLSGIGVLGDGSTAANISVALSAEAEAVSGSLAKVMAKIPEQEFNNHACFRRPSAAIILLLLFSMAAIACGMAFWPDALDDSSAKEIEQASNSPTQTSLENATPVSSSPTIKYEWRSEDGPPEGLDPYHGGWTWTSKAEGMKIGSDGLGVVLPLEVTADPLLLEIRYRDPPEPTRFRKKYISFRTGVGVRWIKGSQLWPHRSYKKALRYGQTYSTQDKLYYVTLIGRRQHIMSGGKLKSTFLVECGKPLPSRFRLGIELVNLQLKGIRLLSLDPDSIPATFKDKAWAALRSQLNVVTTVGPQTLPAKKFDADARSTKSFNYEHQNQPKN